MFKDTIFFIIFLIILVGLIMVVFTSLESRSLSPSECIQVCDLQAEQNLKYPHLNFDDQPYQFNVKSCVKKCISEGL